MRACGCDVASPGLMELNGTTADEHLPIQGVDRVQDHHAFAHNVPPLVHLQAKWLVKVYY